MAFHIIRNDITKIKADAIVNSANPEPIYAGGMDRAVYTAAGEKKLLKEREKIGIIETGQAAVTPAFALNAKYIIHTVGPVWRDGQHGEKESVRECYENSLKLAKELGCESIAFPLIATGAYGFPKAEALQIAISVFSEFLSDEDMQIILVVFDEDSFVLSGKIFSGVDAFIDANYVSEQMEAEYGLELPYVCYGQAYIETDRSERRRGLFKRAESFMGSKPAPSPGRTLDELMAHVSETWQESLFRMIDEKGYTDVEVYKRANIDRKLFSKIRSNVDYQPKKITAVAFALALQLSLDETKDMLGRAGYALSPSSRFDLIIEYFIGQEVYDTYTINLALFKHDQPLLGE